MLRNIRQRIQSEESGFTLIELLVVVLIIGILAAIAIPAFLGQREKAQDSEAKSLARNAQSAAEAYYTDGQTYAGMDLAAMQAIEPSIPSTGFAVTANGTVGYTLTATSKSNNNGRTFTIEKTGPATVNRTCTPVGGGCKSSGW